LATITWAGAERVTRGLGPPAVPSKMSRVRDGGRFREIPNQRAPANTAM